MKLALSEVKKNLLEKKAFLLDVRELDEWQAAHLKNAKHHALSQLQKGMVPKIEKTEKIYLHCRSGNRSKTAEALMKALGYKHAQSLDFSFSSLQEADL